MFYQIEYQSLVIIATSSFIMFIILLCAIVGIYYSTKNAEIRYNENDLKIIDFDDKYEITFTLKDIESLMKEIREFKSNHFLHQHHMKMCDFMISQLYGKLDMVKYFELNK